MLLITIVLLLVSAVVNSLAMARDAPYHLLSEPMTWKEAEQNCRDLGMDLVNIDSVEEQRLLQTLAALEDGFSVWVGKPDRNAQGRLFAKSGELFPENSHLLPSMEEEKDCIALHRLHGVYVTSCMGEFLPSICSAKPRPLLFDITDIPTNLKSSIRRLVRSVEETSTARPRSRNRKHKRRKSIRRSKKRRRFMRRRKYLGVRVTGKATGNMEGYMWGRSTGTATGIISGSLRGSVTGICEGNVTGDITGFMKGIFEDEPVNRWTDGTETGVFTGRMFGGFQGRSYGFCIGEWQGSVVGNTTGEFEGQIMGTLLGNLTGVLQGHQQEYDVNDEEFTQFLGSNIDVIGIYPNYTGTTTLRRVVFLLDGENVGNMSMTGEMWGECTGDLVGNVDGILEGSSLEGAMEGIMEGTIMGNMTGQLSGIATGNLTDLESGEVRTVENYQISDEEEVNLIGELVGMNTGNLVGSVNGSLTGHLTGHFTGSSFGVLQGKLWGSMDGLFDGEIETEEVGVSSNLV